MFKPLQERGRFRYERLDSEHDYCRHVIVELEDGSLDDRSMEFFDREYGEVRWYVFEPEGVEREEVKRLLAEHRDRPADGCVKIDVAKLREAKHFRPAVLTTDAAAVVPAPEPTPSCVTT